jgi:hypothetical protein
METKGVHQNSAKMQELAIGGIVSDRGCQRQQAVLNSADSAVSAVLSQIRKFFSSNFFRGIQIIESVTMWTKNRI